MERWLNFIVIIVSVLLGSCCTRESATQSSVSTGARAEYATNISNLDITSFIQDDYGHIWIGTERGLNRFTGTDYYQYFSSKAGNSIPGNTINSFYKDNKGRIWICTDNGPCYYNLDEDSFIRVAVNAETGYRSASRIIQLESGYLLMSNAFGKVYLYEDDRSSFSDLETLLNKPVPLTTSIYPAQGSHIWLVSYGIIQYVDVLGKEEAVSFPYPKGMDILNSSVMDDSGRIWVFNSKEIACFDTKTREYVEVPGALSRWMLSKDKALQSIYSVQDYLVFQDLKECWVYDLSSGLFVRSDQPESPFSIPSSGITAVYQDRDANVWVGTKGQGFKMVSVHPGPFNRNSALVDAFSGVNVTSVASDGNDNVWAVSSDRHLYVSDRYGNRRSCEMSSLFSDDAFSGESAGIVRTDASNGAVMLSYGSVLSRIVRTEAGIKTVSSRKFSSSIRDFIVQDGVVYAGLSSGDLVIADDGLQSIPVFSGVAITGIERLSDNRLLLYSGTGELKIYFLETSSIEPLNYSNAGNLRRIVGCVDTGDGLLWLATRDEGLLRLDTRSLAMESVEGTSCNMMSSISTDAQGNLWVSSAYGMNFLLNEDSDPAIYYEEDGLGGNQYNEKAGCKLSDGTIVFGGTHGITTCNAMEQFAPSNYPVILESLSVNEEIVSSRDGGFYSGTLFDCPDIVLKHNHNQIIARFAMLDYAMANSVVYMFRLEGRDAFWTNLHGDNTVHLLSLRPGNYILHVTGRSLGEGEGTIKVKIKVKPHPLLSPMMCFVYILMLLWILLAVINFIKQRMNLSLQLEQAEMEKEHEKLVNKVNMNFFADMAHEFRSPLTMIQGPMKQLMEKKNIQPDSYRLLGIMDLNVGKMIRLVNQLLDFNKLDNNKLSLAVIRDYNIVSHLVKLIEITSVNAVRKGIRVTTCGLDKDILVPLDPDKFESIMSNLISNALKFAGNNGSEGLIHLDVESEGAIIRISISNNGKTIPEEEMSRLFDRYYQVREHAMHAKQSGTGIGLNFAHMLAQRMYGSLSAENLPDGSGVKFILELPAENSAYPAADFVDPANNDAIRAEKENANDITGHGINPVEKHVDVTVSEDEKEDQDQDVSETVLVVDDDIDIANYISILLSPYYRVLTANNVSQAMDVINNDMPDIILSDIIMPGDDGISFCKSIKSNMATCHIPVILVTAKVGVDNEVIGLDSGSDAYVTKPFDPTYLVALIRSMLKNRAMLKGRLAETTTIEEVPESLISKQDSEFLERLYALMEAEMGNSELNVSAICDTMCVSRSKLFYKVKSLTGMSMNVLFKTYRLNVASKMLKEGEGSIADIAFKVGFNTPSYFSKAFKAQFGVLPKDVLKD